MKMKNITNTASAFLCSKVRVKTAYAWTSDVHSYIAEKALELLTIEKKLRPAAFYKDWHEEIKQGAVAPDKSGDIDEGPGMHYYSCMNAKGKELDESNGFFRNRLGDFAPSARTLFRANYTSAISLYKSGKIKESMVYLGRAIHFVSDMGCTPHVANMTSGIKASNVHNAFEKQVKNSYTGFKADNFDKRLTKYYEKADPGDAFNKLIKYAGKFVDTILHLDPRAFDDTAKNTIPVTEQHVMAVLLKFFNDCNTDSGNFVCNDKMYTFKNEATGLLLTTTEKNISVDEADKDKDQKLRVKLSETGTFGLRAISGGYINKKCSGYDYLKIDGKAAQFRAEALGNRRFVISTEDSDFKKYLTAKGSKLTTASYEPDNHYMIWVLS
ncbi:zinc dependent phospholipase C family protein [Ruminococcus albus]|uniref:Phospholipase C n=1 Tax=Ruminococcus albus TaxID=1264 RepID=A0A1H7FF12_RUMAL|nr:zinc dependent phospholipase C family protein [Ruminococcus albus]SEK23857.1 Zinc dependent phospholipase C [Ruminococcus albus]